MRSNVLPKEARTQVAVCPFGICSLDLCSVFTNTALFSCSAEQYSAVSRTWHSWRGFEELAVEMLNHHITFLSRLHPERPRGSEGWRRERKREIFRRFVTVLTLRNDSALNQFCRSSDDFNTNLKLDIMMQIKCIVLH